MKRRFSVFAVVCAVLCATAVSTALADKKVKVTPEMIGGAREMPATAVEFKGDCDQVFFPAAGIAIVSDRKGTANISLTLSAYDPTTGELRWTKEVPVGGVDRVLERHIWIDETGSTMFIGNGPLTAIDVQTGSVLWTLEHDAVGLVFDLFLGENRMLIQGTKKPGSFGITMGKDMDDVMEKSQAIRRHLEHPKAICVDRKSGAILWQYEFDPPKDNAPAFLGISVSPNGYYDLESGVTVIQGKHLYGVSNANGQLLWEMKKKTESRAGFSEEKVYPIVDGKVQAINMADGQVVWQSSAKVDKKADVRVFGTRVLAILPGEYDPEKDVFKGEFKIAILAEESGDDVNSEIKGNELQEYPSIEGQQLSICDKKGLRKYDLESGKETFKADRDDLVSYSFAIGDFYVTLEEKGFGCWKSGSSEPECQFSLDRAEKGRKPFLLKTFLMAYNVTNTVANSFYVKGVSDPKQTVWVGTNGNRAPVGFVGSTFIWPSRKNGMVGFSIPDGAIAWHISTGEDPWPFFSPIGDLIAVRDGKKLLFVRL